MSTLAGFLWRDKMENSKLSQTVNLLRFLYRKSTYIKAEEIAEEFSLSNRSIRRLMSELRDLGYNIESVSGPYGGYKLNRSNVILPVIIEEKDKEDFLAIINTIQTSNLPNRDQSLNLLASLGMNSQLSDIKKTDTEIFQTKTLTKEKKAKIDFVSNTLTKAISDRRRVEVKYNSLSKPQKNLVWQEFRPEAFQVFNGILYIKGYFSKDLDKLRVLRLSRVESIRLIDKMYSFNENFKKDNQLAFSSSIFQPQSVKLKISKGPHDILDFNYGKDQSIKEVKDHYILSFKLAGDLLIKELVLSMGKYCELLEPEDIRKSLKEELSVMTSHYKK